MPLTDKQKEYHKKYREEHKKERQEMNKKYYEEHKKEKMEYHKKYREEHKKEKMEYDWKRKGIISDDFDALYDKYINTNECELCNTPITEGSGIKGKKHLDHDHKTGKFRNILCGNCNINIMRFK